MTTGPSAVADKRALDSYYGSGTTFDASAIFRPQDIKIPSLNDHNHVSFNVGSPQACTYSDSGVTFGWELTTFEELLGQLKPRLSLSVDQELERLRSFEADFETLGAEQIAARQRDRLELNVPEQVEGDETIEPPEMYAHENAIRHERIQKIPSVVKRVALEAYFEMDAMLVSISRKALS